MRTLIVIALALCLFEFPRLASAAENPPENASAKDAPAVKESTLKLTPESERRNDISEILNSMGYPELQVVPRASDRLAIESRGEGVLTHWPIELAGLSTLVVGIAAKGNEGNNLTSKQQADADTLAAVGQVVGVGWILTGAIMGAQRPYYRAYYSVNKFNGKDERSQLLRERLADEALEKQARIWRVLETAAVVTNVAANVGMAYHSNENGIVTAGVGVILSFLPWMFEDHNIDVYEKQIEYQKRIYRPIASATVHYDPLHKNYTPMSALAWYF